jgi:hypothetical protein
MHTAFFPDKTFFFEDQFDSKDLNGIAKIYGFLTPNMSALRLTYGLEAMKKPEQTIKWIQYNSAIYLSGYFLKAEGYWIPAGRIREYIVKSMNLRKAIQAGAKPVHVLDRLEKSKLENEKSLEESAKSLGIVIKPIELDYVKYDLTLDTLQMLLFLEKKNKIPFSTMKKMRNAVLEVYGPAECPVSYDFIDSTILYKEMHFFPAEADQIKKLRFRLLGLVAAENDNTLEGIKQATKFLEKMC